MSANSNPSGCQKMLRIFRQHPRKWISKVTLGRAAETMAVPSRVAEIRKDLKRSGFTVKNRQERHGRKIYSFYRIEKLER